MKAFQHRIRQHLILLAILSGIFLVTLGVLYVMEKHTRSSTEELRFQLSTINRLISATHELTRAATPGITATYIEAWQKAREELPEENFSTELERALKSLQMNPDPDQKGSVIGPLGTIARNLSNRYYTVQRIHNVILFGFGGMLTLLILLVLGLSFQIHREYGRYVGRTEELMNSIKNLLDTKKEIKGFTPRWQEELDLLEAVNAIEDIHRSNLELTEHPVYGTLEAFIPKVRAILANSVPCDRVAVAFLDSREHVIAESASSGLKNLYLEPGFVSTLKETTLGEIVKNRKPRIINDLVYHYEYEHQSVATELILQEGIAASVTIPIEIRGNILGFLFVSSTQKNVYTADHVEYIERVLNLLKQNLFYHYIIQQIVSQTTGAFVTLMERKDNETSLHITRMTTYSYVIARELTRNTQEVSPMLIREIFWFAPLHDIGKVGIPDSILLKNAGLNENERQIIEEHVAIGLEVIQSMNKGINSILDLKMLNTAENIISSHHEKFDGSGYPEGLKGEEIPIEGRIVAIADVFDALTSRRPYKEAFPISKALEIIESSVGSHFDPRIYRAFLAALPEIRKIYNRYKEI